MAEFKATGSAGPVAKTVKLKGDAQSGTVGANVSDPLAILVTDAHDNPISGAAVTWAVTKGGGSVAVSAQETDAAGTSKAVWKLGTGVGEHSVTASAGGVESAVSFSATATAGPVATFTVDPSSASVERGTSVQLRAEQKDAFGNDIPTTGLSWSSSNSTVATVSSTGLVTAVSLHGGRVTVTARLPDGRTATSTINATTLPVVTVKLRGPATVRLNQDVLYYASGYDATGAEVIGGTYQHSVADPDILAPTWGNPGGYRAKKLGTTTIRADLLGTELYGELKVTVVEN